jgi:hypothetical protein
MRHSIWLAHCVCLSEPDTVNLNPSRGASASSARRAQRPATEVVAPKVLVWAGMLAPGAPRA